MVQGHGERGLLPGEEKSQQGWHAAPTVPTLSTPSAAGGLPPLPSSGLSSAQGRSRAIARLGPGMGREGWQKTRQGVLANARGAWRRGEKGGKSQYEGRREAASSDAHNSLGNRKGILAHLAKEKRPLLDRFQGSRPSGQERGQASSSSLCGGSHRLPSSSASAPPTGPLPLWDSAPVERAPRLKPRKKPSRGTLPVAPKFASAAENPPPSPTIYSG